MKGSKDESSEEKAKMWEMKEELLNSMSDKELRAFIKGYMMAERMAFKRMVAMSASQGCGCGGCSCSCGEGGSCSCGEKGCGCEDGNCSCGKE